MRIHKIISLVAVFVLGSDLAAQDACIGTEGPGARFGISGYNCATCGFRREAGRRPTYQFYAEPVVLDVERGSPVMVGDVVEAVNGQPITTQAGADQFTYPQVGTNSITVRRGRDRTTLRVQVAPGCRIDWSTTKETGTGIGTDWTVCAKPGCESTARGGTSIGGGVGSGVGSGRSTAATTAGGTGAGTSAGLGGGSGSGVEVRVRSSSGTGPVYVIDGMRVDPNDSVAMAATLNPVKDAPMSKFGFAVECRPSCSMRSGEHGEFLYKYGGYPPIIAVREGSAADRAGLHVGDLITKVDGRSILDDYGLLQRAQQQDQIKLVVRRDGKDINVLMLVTK